MARRSGVHWPGGQRVVDLWGHCPRCDRWFAVEDPLLDNGYLCPVCLQRADRCEQRTQAQ